MSCWHFQGSLDQWWSRCRKEKRRCPFSRESFGFQLGWQVLLRSASIILLKALTTAHLIRSISHLCLLCWGSRPTPGIGKVRLDPVIHGGWLNLSFSIFPRRHEKHDSRITQSRGWMTPNNSKQPKGLTREGCAEEVLVSDSGESSRRLTGEVGRWRRKSAPKLTEKIKMEMGSQRRVFRAFY